MVDLIQCIQRSLKLCLLVDPGQGGQEEETAWCGMNEGDQVNHLEDSYHLEDYHHLEDYQVYSLRDPEDCQLPDM